MEQRICSRTSRHRQPAFIAIVSGVSECDRTSIYNSQIFVDSLGRDCEISQDHLYAVAPVEEQTCFALGETFASFALGDLRFGFSICYDLRFPEIYQNSPPSRTSALSLFHPRGRFHATNTFVCSPKRAIENQSYVIASNRVGKDDDLWFCGSSAIIDPRGVVIAAAPE